MRFIILTFFIVFVFTHPSMAAESGRINRLKQIKVAEEALTECEVKPEIVKAYPELLAGYKKVCAQANCLEGLKNYCQLKGTHVQPRFLKAVDDFSVECEVRPEIVKAYPKLVEGYKRVCAQEDCSSGLKNYCQPIHGQAVPRFLKA